MAVAGYGIFNNGQIIIDEMEIMGLPSWMKIVIISIKFYYFIDWISWEFISSKAENGAKAI